MGVVRLHPDDVDAIARALAEQLRRDANALPVGARYATAAQLAERFQVSLQFVNKHAAELGAASLSEASNSKRRFHVATADAFMDARRVPVHAAPPRLRSGRKPRKKREQTHTPSGAPLLQFT